MLFSVNVSEDEMSAATAAAASLSSLLASTAASTNGANGNRPKSPPEAPNRLANSSPPAPAAPPLNGGGGGGGNGHLQSTSPGISYEGMVSVMSARGTGGPSAGNAASDAEVSTTRENDSSPPSAGSSSRFDIY